MDPLPDKCGLEKAHPSTDTPIIRDLIRVERHTLAFCPYVFGQNPGNGTFLIEKFLRNRCGFGMILERNGTLHLTEDFSAYQLDGDTHYVNGFFYIPGFLAGKESCAQVEKALQETGSIPFKKMRGAFSYCIQRADGEIFFFPCNSLLHRLYVSPYAFSSRYLEHLTYLREQNVILTYDEDALCEYCTLGSIYFGKTYIREITVFSNTHYVHVKDGTLQVLEKGIGDITTPSSIQDPRDFYKDLAHALSAMPPRSVAMPVTGGYDSRMVYSQLYDKVPLRVYLSQNNSLNLCDVPISEKICRITGAELELIHPGKPQVSQEFIQQMIQYYDGKLPGSLESAWIMYFYQGDLFPRSGTQIRISGDSGPLHKDWEWTVDFPFYHRKHTNLRRFYEQRIAYLTHAIPLGSRLSARYTHLADRFVNQMKAYCQPINSQTYDALYYYVTADRSHDYNIATPEAMMYAPLAELDLVRYSYHLPRRKRFFHQYMREVTTSGNREIARIPTNHTTNASSELFYECKDVFCQAYDWGKRAIHMVYRHFAHKLLYQAKKEWSIDEELLALPLAAEAVTWASSQGILAPDTTPKDLPVNYVQRFIVLYVLHSKFGISLPEEADGV